MEPNTDLSDEQKQVLFEKATEAPYSGALLEENRLGDYVCANCQATLFSSDSKYDAGCGWPSFDQAIEDSVNYLDDNSHGMKRIEVTCSNCGGHLGHVFPDGPQQTTGQRYCINSLSLNFHPESN